MKLCVGFLFFFLSVFSVVDERKATRRSDKVLKDMKKEINFSRQFFKTPLAEEDEDESETLRNVIKLMTKFPKEC